MDKNREFAELAGIQWHEQIKSDGLCLCGEMHRSFNASVLNPNFLDAREVVKVMRGRKDFPLFMARLQYGFQQPGITAEDWDHSIDIDYVEQPGLLRDEASRWMKEKG